MNIKLITEIISITVTLITVAIKKINRFKILKNMPIPQKYAVLAG